MAPPAPPPAVTNTATATVLSPTSAAAAQSPGAVSAILCLFCGGILCKYENYRLWTADPEHPNAIPGLFSNWITEGILATQRPSTRLIHEFGLVAAFRRLGITAIFNLQQPDEHESCGDGVEPVSGFSYDPAVWTAAGIHYYNFGWWVLVVVAGREMPDMSVPDFDFALQLAQVMAHSLSNNGKVSYSLLGSAIPPQIAVHCHAGLGRTGLAIACYLLYCHLAGPKEAIDLIRSRRPLSIQTAKQQRFVHQFQEYLVQLQTVFPVPHTLYPSPDAWLSVVPATLASILDNQRLFLAGEELRVLRNVPKVVAQLRELLILTQLRSPENADSGALARWVADHPRTSSLAEGGDPVAICERITGFSAQAEPSLECRRAMVAINAGRWEVLEREPAPSASLLVDLLLHWLVLLNEPLLSAESVRVIVDVKASEAITIMSRVQREVFWTVNCILDIFRYMPAGAPIADALYRLAVLCMHQRSEPRGLLDDDGGGPPPPSPQHAGATATGVEQQQQPRAAVAASPRGDSLLGRRHAGRDAAAWAVSQFLFAVVRGVRVRGDDGVRPVATVSGDGDGGGG
ncbi:Protein tyrosine phosphatase domain-containing protein 1 [Cladochytrium tenue]|nr:Protein tyrosine phosphatase domain-containing protein 1 [Cladochytrium tenue]